MTVSLTANPASSALEATGQGGQARARAQAAKNMNPELSAEPKLKAMPSDEYKDGLLSRGKATGGIRYATPDGRGKLQVRIGRRGRGLFASSTIQKSKLNVLYLSLCKNSTELIGLILRSTTPRI